MENFTDIVKDIRIRCGELQEGGFVAHVYTLEALPRLSDGEKSWAENLGNPIYGNTAPQVKAKILARLSTILDTLLPAEKPKEK